MQRRGMVKTCKQLEYTNQTLERLLGDKLVDSYYVRL
jgi:hypothetical protein